MTPLLKIKKLFVLAPMAVLFANIGSCNLEELLPLEQFTRDSVRGWIAALLL